jgi:hypothetical protein
LLYEQQQLNLSSGSVDWREKHNEPLPPSQPNVPCPGNSFWNGYGCASRSQPSSSPALAPSSIATSEGIAPARSTRPLTGTILSRSDGLRGQGELSIVNGLTMDAVVTLRPPHAATSYISFYVRAGENAGITNIAKGEYELSYMLGENWTDGQFAKSAGSVRLNQRLTFVDSSIVIRSSEGTSVRNVPGEPWKLVLRPGSSSSNGSLEKAPARSARTR